MSITALRKLVTSGKATVLVAVIALFVVALKFLTPEEVDKLQSLLQYLVPGWMLAHAGETGAKALAKGKELPTAKPAPETPLSPSQAKSVKSAIQDLEAMAAGWEEDSVPADKSSR